MDWTIDWTRDDHYRLLRANCELESPESRFCTNPSIIAMERCNETFVLVSRYVRTRAHSEMGGVSCKCRCGFKILPRALRVIQ